MLNVNPRTKVEVVPLHDRYGRSVAVRTLASPASEEIDSVYVCAGDNAVFVANVIALAYAHNSAVDAAASRNWCDGI
jgi:hypothetical protein